jgi:2-hydroxychromene-2-carboxylate isomerase
MRKLDYYFSVVSPWAFIGHDLFMSLVARHGLVVNYKPVFLGQVFAETGGLPLNQRHPVRQRYRLVELQRWREKRGLEFAIQPEHWPFYPTLLDRFVIALGMADHDPDPFLRRLFAAIWTQERDLRREDEILALARDCGLDGPALLEGAKSTATEVVYALNLENAVASDVFGSPAYVLDGEVFWGQDRLELLDDALSSGRRAFRPPT